MVRKHKESASGGLFVNGPYARYNELTMIPSPFGQFAVHIPITPLLLFATLALLIAVWAVFTLIVRYHWKNYGTGKLEVFTMNFFYLVGSLVLIALMVVCALLYLSSAT